MRGSREISLVPSLHRASTDALITQPYSDAGTTNYTANEELSPNYADQTDRPIISIISG